MRGLAGLLALLCLCPVAMAQGGAGQSASIGALTPTGSGERVYQRYCVTCHGEKADGKGPAAALYQPRPADLTASTRSDLYKELIIRNGGGAVGRSVSMPAWGNELDEKQIHDLVEYLRSVKVAEL
jgi:cytochrome c oxidase cbb3-type subunit 3